MIVNNKIEVKINSKNFDWYFERGYSPFEKGDTIIIDSKDLTYGSAKRIDVECQSCLGIISVKMYNYYYQLKRHNFYVCQKCNFQKVKLTNKNLYGEECALRTEKNIKKAKEKMIKTYGVDNISKLDSIRNERSLNMKEKTEEYNEIIKEKYGVKNVSELEWIKEKKKETLMKNWGVENPIQNYEIFEKAQISGKRIKKHDKFDLYYRGSYEKHFLDFCYEKNIKVKKGCNIKFKMNGKSKVYFSDFFIPKINTIVEIKSYYYYYKYLDLNKTKENETMKAGYNHLFIIDKDYTQLSDKLKIQI